MQKYNPIIPVDKCMADGEPHVFNGKVYLFGSHDTPGGDSFCLEDYEFYSAPLSDLSDWTSNGLNYSAKQDPLYDDDCKYLYAPDVVRGNDGKYYLYYCLAGWKGKGGYSHPISVAVCDTPDGKYEYLGYVQNQDGSPYLEWVCFDPAVINDNGIIRIYFGSGPYLAKNIKWWNAFYLRRKYSKTFGKPIKSFKQKPGPLGANVAVLEDDMLTLKERPKRIANTKDFKGHEFFEGSSIRKINDTYYFVYSSETNHELCYATSKYPDKGFEFRGTIVSNGDIGLNDRKPKDRLNITGTTHGGIEFINGQLYVFYHRLTHGSDYSRQECVEKLNLLPDGSIPQVEVTSSGLSDNDLEGLGEYPAVICCNLTNGVMPHSSNGKQTNIPMITHQGEEFFIKDCDKNTQIVYKYFNLECTSSFDIVAKGKGKMSILINDELIENINIDSANWCSSTTNINKGQKHSKLALLVNEGNVSLYKLIFK